MPERSSATTDTAAQQEPVATSASTSARGAGVHALDQLLQSTSDPAQVAALIEAYRGDRDAMFARLHTTLGNSYVQWVVAALPGKAIAGTEEGNRATVATAATAAVERTIATLRSAAPAASAPTAKPVSHPILAAIGHEFGVGIGIIVTEALRVVPSWNDPVLDASGAPVVCVPGVTREGSHEILKRHEEVIGPRITALVGKLSPGAIHDVVAGFGAGATEAPGDSYRLEVAFSDLLDSMFK